MTSDQRTPERKAQERQAQRETWVRINQSRKRCHVAAIVKGKALFANADGNGQLSNSPAYVFTEWAGGAADDLDALRKVFDSNGDGKLTSADVRWGEFRVLVTQADGSKVTRTLAELGITEINLTADATKLVSVDGSAITGQAKFKINGVDRTVANTRLMAEAAGHRVVEAVTVLSPDRSWSNLQSCVRPGRSSRSGPAFALDRNHPSRTRLPAHRARPQPNRQSFGAANPAVKPGFNGH